MSLAASPDVGPWLDLDPPPLPAIPALTSRTERRYCYWLTRERFTGAGEVVELGCWLGAATVNLAAGLRDHGSPAKVTSIDRFTWAGAAHDRAFPGQLRKGDDFEPLFRANIASLAQHIEVVRANLERFTWEGAPIELLLVDAPKKRQVVLAFLQAFGPHLIVGRSLVVFQDYLHAPSFALPAVLSEFDELRVAHVVLPGSTVSMELTRPLVLDPERLARCDPARWSEAETLERWRRVLEPLPEKTHGAMALSLPMLLMSQGRIESARAEAARIAHIPAVQARLNKWKSTYLAVMYRPVFEAAGIEVRPTTPEMHHWISSEALKAGRRDAARDAVEEALRLNPTYAPAQRRLATIDRQIAAETARRQRIEAKARAHAELSRKAATAPVRTSLETKVRKLSGKLGKRLRRGLERWRRLIGRDAR